MALPSIKDLEEILFSQEVIQRRVKELASQILCDYSHQELIWVTVMKGADNFSRDLRKELVGLSLTANDDLKVDLVQDVVMMSLYSNPNHPEKETDFIVGPDPKIGYEGKDVLIVEDIVDRGRTMQCLISRLNTKKPKSIHVCCLLSKNGTREVNIPLRYVGFAVENKFVVGYGLDYNQKYRDLPMIGVLKPEIYSLKLA